MEVFKARVVELALAAAADQGFALAGGNALAAHGLLSRPTEDVDLSTPQAAVPAA
ncbi:MAG: nucleotidyl transferase AbiEii/AbiGii toxin family protein [Mycobacteriales bacterium]